MNKFIDDLIAIGLTVNQAKAYFFLLTHPNITATELSKISRIPRARVYNVLESLNKSGFCVEINDKIKHYKAIRPAEALSLLDQKLLSKREKLIKVSDTLDKLYLLENSQEDPLDFIEVITDRSKQLKKIEFMDDLVRFELYAMCKAPFDRRFLEDPASILKKYSDNEIKYRFLIEVKKGEERKMRPLMNGLSESGVDVKKSSYLPFKMNIFDSRKISFYKTGSAADQSEPILMVMKDSTLVKLFKSVFNQYYNSSE